jgi:hypothetical protein
MSAAPSVVLFSTSVAVQAKTQADIARIKRILDAKRVSYEEVCFGEQRANVCAPQPTFYLSNAITSACSH